MTTVTNTSDSIIVTLETTETDGTMLKRDVPYSFAVQMLGSGFRKVKIYVPETDVILDLEGN